MKTHRQYFFQINFGERPHCFGVSRGISTNQEIATSLCPERMPERMPERQTPSFVSVATTFDWNNYAGRKPFQASLYSKLEKQAVADRDELLLFAPKVTLRHPFIENSASVITASTALVPVEVKMIHAFASLVLIKCCYCCFLRSTVCFFTMNEFRISKWICQIVKVSICSIPGAGYRWDAKCQKNDQNNDSAIFKKKSKKKTPLF